MFTKYKNIFKNKLVWLYLFILLVSFILFSGVTAVIVGFILSLSLIKYFSRLGYNNISKIDITNIYSNDDLISILTQNDEYTREDLKDIDVYIVDDTIINAKISSDIWGDYIIITSLAVELLQPEELASIIAHELGHIDIKKPTKIRMYTYITNIIGIFMIGVILYSLSYLIQGVIFLLPLYILYNVIDSYRSRLEEYIADEYAVYITGEKPVVDVLSILQKQAETAEQDINQTIDLGIVSYNVNDHPHPNKRIQNIKKT